jgi:hypothetical protein
LDGIKITDSFINECTTRGLFNTSPEVDIRNVSILESPLINDSHTDDCHDDSHDCHDDSDDDCHDDSDDCQNDDVDFEGWGCSDELKFNLDDEYDVKIDTLPKIHERTNQSDMDERGLVSYHLSSYASSSSSAIKEREDMLKAAQTIEQNVQLLAGEIGCPTGVSILDRHPLAIPWGSSDKSLSLNEGLIQGLNRRFSSESPVENAISVIHESIPGNVIFNVNDRTCDESYDDHCDTCRERGPSTIPSSWGEFAVRTGEIVAIEPVQIRWCLPVFFHIYYNEYDVDYDSSVVYIYQELTEISGTFPGYCDIPSVGPTYLDHKNIEIGTRAMQIIERIK